ncbi:Separin [Holothuria leucospilota]|uniref:separase n=1 Tax=Holothuria leucospilota TaxID=206669 RepID=A0A9Q1C1K9_HOLLE|nr:Separin [Holothuria leucospilota]
MASEKLVAELQGGRIDQKLVKSIQSYLGPVLTTKGSVTAPKEKHYGLLSMKILRACVQLLHDGKIEITNICHLVQLSTQAYHCIQKTKSQQHPVYLALEKLLFHIFSGLLKANFLADALTFAEYLLLELEEIAGDNRDNEFENICKQAYNQIWKSCLNLQKSSVQLNAKCGLVLHARFLALSFLLITNHDFRWIMDAFIRSSVEYEQNVGKNQVKYEPLCNFFQKVLQSVLQNVFIERMKDSLEDVTEMMLCPIVDVIVQYAKCCLLASKQHDAIEATENLSELLHKPKWRTDSDDSLSLLRATLSLLKIIVYSSLPTEEQSSKNGKKKGKKMNTSKCTLLNTFSKDVQVIKKIVEKEDFQLAPMNCLVEVFEIFRKKQEQRLNELSTLQLSEKEFPVHSSLCLYVEILNLMKQFYSNCVEGDKVLRGKSPCQLIQRCLSRSLATLNLMSSIHLHQLKQVSNTVDNQLIADCIWVCKRTDEIISSVSEGSGGALSVDEHMWLGTASFNLGVVLYQKQMYEASETLLLLSNHHLLLWSTEGDSLLVDRTQQINLWSKMELLLDCQRRLNKWSNALDTIAKVLMCAIKENKSGIQVQKWLELWSKVKRDLAKKDENEELRSRNQYIASCSGLEGQTSYLGPVLATKGSVTAPKEKHYGLLSMKILRACVQLLHDGKIEITNICHLVQLSTQAFHCIQKTKSQQHPVYLALEKLLFHIFSGLLKANFFADALTFAEYLLSELEEIARDNRDNEFENICKQAYNQIWKSCLNLQKSSVQLNAKCGLVLHARFLALSFLLITNHDFRWIMDAFIRSSVEYEQNVGKNQVKYEPLCNFFQKVLQSVLQNVFTERMKDSLEEDVTEMMLCPVVDVIVQYAKCCLLASKQHDAIEATENLSELLHKPKWRTDSDDSLSLLRATLSLLKIILYSSLPTEEQSSKNGKKKGKKMNTSKCTLLNTFSKDVQVVKKILEKEDFQLAPMNCLVEVFEIFRKKQEQRLNELSTLQLSEKEFPVHSSLCLYVEILNLMKQFYSNCVEGDKVLRGKSPCQLIQRCLSRSLATLNLMSSIHLHQLKQVSNTVDNQLIADCIWVCKRTDEIISSVSEGSGGALSVDEHMWLGTASFNLGVVLYQKQMYEASETLLLLSNHHLLLWSTEGDSLLVNRTQQINLWSKMELLLDCQRRLNKWSNALDTIAKVLMCAIKENKSGIQFLKIFWLFSRHETLHEEYAVVCDLLDLYQGDEFVAERAVILLKLCHLLRTGRFESDNVPVECVETAIMTIQEVLSNIKPSNSSLVKQLQDSCLQLQALQIAVKVSEILGCTEELLAGLCSLVDVLCTLGGLQEASACLEKAQTLLTSLSSPPDTRNFLKCCLILSQSRLLLYKQEMEAFVRTVSTIFEVIKVMHHNYSWYYVSAQVKLLLALYSSTPVNGDGPKCFDFHGEINIDLSPMEPAQEAMRLFTGVAKGVMGKDFNANVDLSKFNSDVDLKHSGDISCWMVLDKVLKSLLLVGKLYTQQGCVREAKYYFQEGLGLCQLYSLPRWITLFNLHLCESYNLQGLAKPSQLALKTVLDVLQGGTSMDLDNAREGPGGDKQGNHPSHQTPSVDESEDDSFVLHSRKMSFTDLFDEEATSSECFPDLSVPSPSFITHCMDCSCNTCMDVELHKSWLSLYVTAAEMVGTEHKQFGNFLADGHAVWNWCKDKWKRVVKGSVNDAMQYIQVQVSKKADQTEPYLSTLALGYAKLLRMQAISQLHFLQYEDVSSSIEDGLNTLKHSHVRLGEASVAAELLYLKALKSLYLLNKSGCVKQSLNQLMALCWPDSQKCVTNGTEDVTQQLGHLKLSEENGGHKTPISWTDSISEALSRPELCRKQTDSRDQSSESPSLDSLGLFSDIADNEPDKTGTSKPKKTHVKKKSVQAKSKKGSVIFSIEKEMSDVNVCVESSATSDVYSFDVRDTEDVKPKKGRGKGKKLAEKNSTVKANSRARGVKGKNCKVNKYDDSEEGNQREKGMEEMEADLKSTKSKSSKSRGLTSRKPSARRGRPAATEKVRGTDEQFEESFHISDESFSNFSDQDEDEVGVSSPRIHGGRYQCEDIKMTVISEEILPWSGHDHLEYEDVEIPRALSEEEEAVAPRRGRRKPVEKKAQGNKKNVAKVNETEAYGVDHIIGILEEALQLVNTSAPNPIYRQICQLLALCLGEKQPQRAAQYLSQATSVTLRHQKLSSVAKKLRKLKKLEDLDVEEEEKGSKRHSQQEWSHKRESLLASSQLFSFTSEGSTLEDVTHILPEGWTVCQLSIIDVSPVSAATLTDTCFLVITKLERGEAPLLLHIPLVENGPCRKSAEDLMEEFDQILHESKETVKKTDKRVWWASRQSLNEQLKSIINGHATMSRQELLQVLASLLGLSIGSEDLSNAVAFFQKLTEDISPRLKPADRYPSVLILDKHLQHIPWESMPVLRRAPVFRMPSLHFLQSHLKARSDSETVLGAGVNIGNTFFVLNPSKDLINTQKVFQDWFEKEQMWSGVTGRIPSKEEYTAALTNQDLFIYCGHGNGREYFSGDEIQRLTCRAVTLLIGCSSGKLTVSGTLDAAGMAQSYIVADCPCIVANLWDVTDRDIDRFLEHLLKTWLDSDSDSSLLDFLSEARSSCKLQYLIGSSPVMYGLPIHLS